MHRNPRLIFIFLFILILNEAAGQKLVNSPYSRFNFGSLNPAGSFRSMAMGGTGIAARDNNSVYFDNPASYSSIDTASFIFDFGLDWASVSLNDGTNSHTTTDLNFNHLLLGFPLTRNMGFAAGLVPVSNGYYYLSEKISSGDPGYDPITGEVAYIHKGTGSISKVFAGAGLRLTRNLSAGANFTVTLGQIERLNQFEFADFTSTFNQRGSELLRVSGINLDYGLQYYGNIGKSYFFNAGFSLTAGKKYKSTFESLKERFTVYGSTDTLIYTNNTSADSTRLPASYRLGLSFGMKDKFTVEANYIRTQWADAMVHGDNSTLASTSSYRLGLEYIPEKFSNTSFLKRIEYRLGVHYSDNYLVLNGVQLKEYGVTCGFGIRMMASSYGNPLSKATFFFDYTRREGNLSKGLHNENIFSAGVSLNLYDFWFIKRKFD